MGNNYSYEFNRSFPHQTEGPEISPYFNKNAPRKKISASVASVVTVMAAVVVAAIVLASPLGFYVDNVNATSAELFFDVSEEAGFVPEDVVSYRMLCGGEKMEESLLPHTKASISFLKLSPDTYYSVHIIRNGEILKTLNFRTPPIKEEAPIVSADDTTLAPETTPPETTPLETTPPETTPLETTPPETTPAPIPPVIGPIEITQMEGKYIVTVSTQLELNDATPKSFLLLFDGKKYPIAYDGSCYKTGLSELSAGEHTCTLKLDYILGGVDESISVDATFTVRKIYVPLAFSGFGAKQAPLDRTATLELDVEQNDSEILSISVLEKGVSLSFTRNNNILTLGALSVGSHNISVKIEYETNGERGEVSQTKKLTIKEPPKDMVINDVPAFLEWQSTLDFDGSITPNDAKNITAIFATKGGKKLGEVAISGQDNEFWLWGHVENLPELGNKGYEIYKVIFSYKLNGVAKTQSVNVLVSQYGYPAGIMPSASPGVVEGKYDVWFSVGDVFIDADIKSIKIDVCDDNGIKADRTAFNKTYSKLKFSTIDTVIPQITINKDETSVSLRITIIFEIGGYEFIMTEWCGLA